MSQTFSIFIYSSVGVSFSDSYGANKIILLWARLLCRFVLQWSCFPCTLSIFLVRESTFVVICALTLRWHERPIWSLPWQRVTMNALLKKGSTLIVVLEVVESWFSPWYVLTMTFVRDKKSPVLISVVDSSRHKDTFTLASLSERTMVRTATGSPLTTTCLGSSSWNWRDVYMAWLENNWHKLQWCNDWYFEAPNIQQMAWNYLSCDKTVEKRNWTAIVDLQRNSECYLASINGL